MAPDIVDKPTTPTGYATRASGLQAATQLPPAGYDLGEVIGRGGMGEVLVAHDQRIGRDVAIKRLRDDEPDEELVARFLREARIQARLDHPAIVPVYEVGEDERGLPYFTMKRLAGVTLAKRIVEGTQAQRLLPAFVDVCLALELAHARGVLHRDLKPSNIMLGDFGEVYVLDWGIARITGDPDEAGGVGAMLDGDTEVGSTLGTPGYMAPEQIRGERLGPAADVYALGCILFEILVGESLHPRGEPSKASTLGGRADVGRRPERAVAPELDAACRAALAVDPAARPSARALADRIQRYLDGDRDLAQRRQLAGEQLARARAALAADDRAAAMQAGGRALALDPESTEAAALVTQLMLEPPREPPPGLRDELRRWDGDHVRRHARVAAFAYLAMLPLLPLVMWSGVRSWTVLVSCVGIGLVLSAAARQFVARPDRSTREMIVYAVGNGAYVALLGRIMGPFVLVPALACTITMSMMAYPLFAQRRQIVVVLMTAGWLVPLALEYLGVLDTTWFVAGNGIVSTSNTLDINPATIGLLLGATLGTIVVAGFLSGVQARSHFDARHQLVAQAWHLRQLLPDAGDSRRALSVRD